MTLAESVHIGDRYPKAPSWIGKGESPAAEPATVVYIHPEGRYCTVQFANGLTDTVQTVPAERVAAPVSDGYDISARRHYNHRNRPNLFLRDWLKGMPVSQREVSVAMGHNPKWLNNQLYKELTHEERDEIMAAAERIAAERSK
ncbi:MAG: hypothetical protein LUF28_05530 [Clostridiales bacterium]|nr:hypothetical protein [Clostridiales bacterium]